MFLKIMGRAGIYLVEELLILLYRTLRAFLTFWDPLCLASLQAIEEEI